VRTSLPPKTYFALAKTSPGFKLGSLARMWCSHSVLFLGTSLYASSSAATFLCADAMTFSAASGGTTSYRANSIWKLPRP